MEIEPTIIFEKWWLHDSYCLFKKKFQGNEIRHTFFFFKKKRINVHACTLYMNIFNFMDYFAEMVIRYTFLTSFGNGLLGLRTFYLDNHFISPRLQSFLLLFHILQKFFFSSFCLFQSHYFFHNFFLLFL